MCLVLSFVKHKTLSFAYIHKVLAHMMFFLIPVASIITSVVAFATLAPIPWLRWWFSLVSLSNLFLMIWALLSPSAEEYFEMWTQDVEEDKDEKKEECEVEMVEEPVKNPRFNTISEQMSQSDIYSNSED